MSIDQPDDCREAYELWLISGWDYSGKATFEAWKAGAKWQRERESGDEWQPMATAPHGVAILARGWDFGKPNTSRHYSLVIYDNGQWKGVGNDTDWQYLTDWKRP